MIWHDIIRGQPIRQEIKDNRSSLQEITIKKPRNSSHGVVNPKILFSLLVLQSEKSSEIEKFVYGCNPYLSLEQLRPILGNILKIVSHF